MYKLGIDVGGTNTDAVLIDEDLNVVAAVKNPTSDDIYTGIMGAVDAVLADGGVDRAQIAQAMLGTTQCTNAIVERKGLAPIAILRIGAPATVGIPPMVDWADDIAAVCVDALVIEGGGTVAKGFKIGGLAHVEVVAQEVARHGGDGADDGAADERERRGAEADDERVARAVHHARQHVAALVVGAEQELGIGGLACREDLKRVVRRQDVGEHGDHDDQDEHDERDARSDAHGLPPAEMHLAGIGFHLISEVSSKFDHVATPS